MFSIKLCIWNVRAQSLRLELLAGSTRTYKLAAALVGPKS